MPSHFIKMWINRTIEAEILALAAKRPVVALSGARQTGKTSLLRRCFPEHSYVSLDLPSEAEQAEQDPDSFLSRHPCPVIIDEVQYAPKLFRHIKGVVDQRRKQSGQFLLTGSQQFRLMKEVSDSLAGRAALLTLEGLSEMEILAAHPDAPLTERLWRGGWPELWQDRSLDPVSFLNSYIATYLERDVRSFAQVGSLRDFERFLRACALRSANLLNKADLARDVGVAPSTINQWISIVEAAGQILLLEPWFNNQGKRQIKSPKLYLADTGLLCALLNLRSPDAISQCAFVGAIWETYVATQLRHRVRRSAPTTRNLYFWRDGTREVDFVTESDGELSLWEAKWKEHPTTEDAVNLHHALHALGPSRIARASIIGRPPNRYPVAPGIEAVSTRDL